MMNAAALKKGAIEPPFLVLIFPVAHLGKSEES
jgi:hypothetical protein